MKSCFRTSAACFIVGLGAIAPAQVSLTVGPSPAPIGCPIAITIANDTSAPIFLSSPCPFQVQNQFGAAVYSPFCPAVIVTVNPGSVFTANWPQVDDFGNQVPAGTYQVAVTFPGGTSTSSLVIDANIQAGIGHLGQVRVGTTRSLEACAPRDAGFAYLMGASGFPASGGIVTCGGIVPLQADWILTLSLGPNPYFANFSGGLGSNGTSTSPSITVPPDPALAGISFVVAFVVLDPNAACIVRRISGPLLVMIT